MTDNCYLMNHIKGHEVCCAPLYLCTINVKVPPSVMEAQRLYQKYSSYGAIQNVPERLCWCRYRLGLKQKEVAEIIGVTKAVYQNWENAAVDLIPAEKVDKLAALYRVPIEDLMSDYTKFLYDGQGKQLKMMRETIGLNQAQFAALIGMDAGNYRKYESEQLTVSRKTWQKYFKEC